MELIQSQNLPLALIDTNKGQLEGLPANPRIIRDRNFRKLKKSIEDNPEMTALREIKEEVGLDVRIDTGFREVTTYSPYPGVIKDVVYFIAHLAGKDNIKLQREEVIGYEWATPQGARNALTFRGDRELIEKALAYIGK